MRGNQVERAMAIAEAQLGKPYVWATAGPDTFDCSGFTWWVAIQVLGPLDYELRSSHHQFNVWGEPVNDELRRGDLVFFDVGQGVIMGNRAGHVGFFLGGDRFIHAANQHLGVRYDALDSAWYAPRYIGARRIFTMPTSVASEPTLRLPTGPIRTAAPWNGWPIGADWGLIARWAPVLVAAAADAGVDPVDLAVIMAIETQGLHERDGQVLEVWDHHPEDGPSVGVMQVKPKVWGYLLPNADAWTAEDNIRLGAAVLRTLIDRWGSFEAAIAGGYHPGASPNGTTPGRYVLATRSLRKEIAGAA